MNKSKVWIPEPCHMTWKEMDKIENSTSRHCKECSVDLVDFTTMTDDEMIAYLSTRKEEKVCVRMYEADALENASKTQVTLLNWYKRVKSSSINRHLKAAALIIFRPLLLTACGCEVDDIPCERTTVLVPDTTTVDPTDSIEVVRCD